MTAPFADLNDSLLGWASEQELKASGRNADKAYFPAQNLTADELERVERLFGIFLARQVAAGADLGELMAATPALSAATLIARAGRAVSLEELPAEYLSGLGVEPTSEFVAVVTSRLDGALEAAGLERPEQMGATEALVYQAGLHQGDIAPLMELLDDGDDDLSGLEYSGFLQEKAPERLSELVSGIERIREFSTKHPTSWLDREPLDAAPGLPRLVADAAIAELRERPVGTSNRLSAVGVALRELRPRLVFDDVRGRVCLRLPEQRVGEDTPEVVWRVTQSGTTRVFRTGRPWGEPRYAEALDIAVERQVREVTVADETNGIQWTVPVVAADDPLLVFSAGGQNLTDKPSLHHPGLIVLAPEDARLVDVVADADVATGEAMPVQGWQGWSARRVEATELASLQLVRPGETPSAMHPVRSVDVRHRVRFTHPGEPLKHVVTGSGLPVYSRSLLAEFFPTPSGREETWQLSISAYAGVGESAEEITEPEPLIVPAEGGVFEIFDPEAYDAAWVGEYLVRLRGPRNESFRHRYAIVEGMGVEPEIEGAPASVRIPTQAGLSTARLAVTRGEKDFEVSPRRIEVAADAAAAEFAVTTEDGDQLPLRFRPPALKFQLPLTSYPPAWRTSRLFLGPRRIDPQGRVRVRTPEGIERPRLSVRNQHGSPVRTLSLEAEDAVTSSAPAEQLAKAAAVLPQGRIEVEWTDPAAGARVSVTLAAISSQPHASAVTIEDGELVAIDMPAGRSLSAWLWPRTAPWAGATTIDVASERTPLPEHLVGAGDLTVQFFSRDRFTVLRAPEQPGPDALVAKQPGYFATPGSEALTGLAAFFAGEAEEPPASSEVLPIIWSHFGASERERDVAQRVFAADPTAALVALADSLVPANKQPGRMIQSGLVQFPFGAAERPAETSDWIASLVVLGAIGEEIDNDPDPARLRALMAEARGHAGQQLVDILRTGQDRTLDTACVDASTVRIAHMNQAQQQQLIDMFFSRAEIVPGQIMEDSSRLMAVFEAFKRRSELNALVATEGLIKPVVSLLRALRKANRALYSAARIRFDKIDGVDTEDPDNAWALAPVVSMVFALTARMHAHGMLGKSNVLDSAAEGWSQLADLVPDLVTSDLVSAEALILAVRGSRD